MARPHVVILLLYTAWTTKAWRSLFHHNQPYYHITGSFIYLHNFQLFTYELLPIQKSAACISSRYHFKLSQALLQAFTNLTAWTYIGDVVTVRPVSITLTILFTNVFFTLLTRNGLLGTLATAIVGVSTYVLASFGSSTRVTLFYYYTPYSRSINTVRFALLATYASSSPGTCRKERHYTSAWDRVDTTLSLLTANFSVM